MTLVFDLQHRRCRSAIASEPLSGRPPEVVFHDGQRHRDDAGLLLLKQAITHAENLLSNAIRELRQVTHPAFHSNASTDEYCERSVATVREKIGVARERALPSRRKPAILAATLMIVSTALAAVPPNEPIQPIPWTLKQDPVRTAIGRRLFADPRLSGNGRVSCTSCHDLRQGGADGRSRSTGLRGEPTEVNTPTVLNAALNFRQFWDGRADSLESQVDQVIRNSNEMGSTWDAVILTISADAEYRKSFESAYKDGITQANIQNAVATFERTLLTPNSRFDRYLRGDGDAISAAEKAGYAKFKQYGCVACHQGVTVGGNMFQKFGVMADYFARRGNPTPADMGRYMVTHDVRDKHVFKVPSLRNVELTAPYFHDGSAITLESAVDVMFQYQLGRTGSREDKDAIVKFLRTLTGELAAQP